MGLSGTLETMSLTDLLQWVGSTRKTGTLAIRGRSHTKHVYLKDGRVIASASDDPTEQLGQFLLSRGRITEDQLRKALEAQAKSRILLGKVLLMTGAVKEADLKQMLQLQAEETIFGLFLWSDAHFEFLEGVLPNHILVPISLEVQQVLMAGLARLDELEMIQADFGSFRSVLQRTGELLPPGLQDGNSLPARALALVDGKRSIADISPAVHASEFVVGRALHMLFGEGLLEVVKRVTTESPAKEVEDNASIPAEVLLANGRERLQSGDADAAVEILRRAMAASPNDKDVLKLYETACISFRAKVYASDLLPDSTPVLLQGLNDLTDQEFTPEEGFLLSRIDGSWTLKSIIDVSPISEVDALRLMLRLRDRKIIELR